MMADSMSNMSSSCSLFLCLCFDVSIPFCYQVVPKSQKYFSLPAGKSLERSSFAGKLFKQFLPVIIMIFLFKCRELVTSPGTVMYSDHMPDSHQMALLKEQHKSACLTGFLSKS